MLKEKASMNPYNAFTQIALMVVLITTAGWGQVHTAEQVLDSLQAHFGAIQDYSVDVDVVIQMEKGRIPPMRVTVYYKKPDKWHYQSNGFAFLPKDAVMIAPERFRKLMSGAKLQGIEQVENHLAYHLVLHLQEKRSSHNAKIHLWVDKSRWVILKIRTESPEMGYMELNIEHHLVENRFWLPKKTVVQIHFEPIADNLTGSSIADSIKTRHSPMRQIFRHGVAYVTFYNYKVNQGLPDELFQGKKK